MRRTVFLGGVGAALASRAALAQDPPEAPISEIVAGVPGITGVYARALGKADPLVALRADERFPSASVIKLPIMVTAFRAFDAGYASPNKQIGIRRSDRIGGSPVVGAAGPNDRFSLLELVRAMIQFSDNTAANTLMTALTLHEINTTIRGAGMTGTVLARHFKDVVPPGQRNLNTTTPSDIGRLLYQIDRGAHEGLTTVASTRACRQMLQIMLGQHYRDMIPAGIKRKVPIANKTGELDNVRSDAAVVDPFGDDPYVLVVLTRDLDDTGAGRRAVSRIAHRVDGLFQKADQADTAPSAG